MVDVETGDCRSTGPGRRPLHIGVVHETGNVSVAMCWLIDDLRVEGHVVTAIPQPPKPSGLAFLCMAYLAMDRWRNPRIPEGLRRCSAHDHSLTALPSQPSAGERIDLMMCADGATAKAMARHCTLGSLYVAQRPKFTDRSSMTMAGMREQALGHHTVRSNVILCMPSGAMRCVRSAVSRVDAESWYVTANSLVWRAVNLMRVAADEVSAWNDVLAGDAHREPDDHRSRMRGELWLIALLILIVIRRCTAVVVHRLPRRSGSAPSKWEVLISDFEMDVIPLTLCPEQSRRQVSLDLQRFWILPAPKDRFYADPFVAEDEEGRHFVLFEDCDLTSGLGRISAVELEGSVGSTEPRVVLEAPGHLSYPQIFRYESEWYMTMSRLEDSVVQLYQATSFPWSWRIFATILVGRLALDPTIYFDGETFWLFANTPSHGTLYGDELSLFFSRDLSGPYHQHPQNPIVLDVRCGRPAGSLFMVDSELIRPAQDGSKGYGSGITFCRVAELSKESYREVKTGHISGVQRQAGGRDLHGLHTYNADGRFQVLDARIVVEG